MSDMSRFTDWSPDTVEFLEEVPVPPTPPTESPVMYEKDKVTAYFDDEGRSVLPSLATWAKVWTPDGKLTIVSLVAAATPPPAPRAAWDPT